MGGISDDSTTLTYGQGSASRTLHLDVQMPGQPPRSAKAGGASQQVAWQPNAFRVSAPKQQRPATSEGRLVRTNADGTHSPAKGRPPSAPAGGGPGPVFTAPERQTTPRELVNRFMRENNRHRSRPKSHGGRGLGWRASKIAHLQRDARWRRCRRWTATSSSPISSR